MICLVVASIAVTVVPGAMPVPEIGAPTHIPDTSLIVNVLAPAVKAFGVPETAVIDAVKLLLAPVAPSSTIWYGADPAPVLTSRALTALPDELMADTKPATVVPAGMLIALSRVKVNVVGLTTVAAVANPADARRVDVASCVTFKV